MERNIIAVYGCKKEEKIVFYKVAKEVGVKVRLIQDKVSKENAYLADGASCVSVNHESEIDKEILSVWNDLGISYISTRSIGYNHIDMKSAKRFGLEVENVAYSPGSVAEHALMQMLMLVRNMKLSLQMTGKHDFSLLKKRSKELSEMTIGIVGTGKIGCMVATLLQGFGCKIICFDTYENEQMKALGAEYMSYEGVLKRSDLISFHIPLTEESYHILDEKALALCKEDVYIVNTARGGLIDTKALLDALQVGKVAGVALDVFEGEEQYFYKDCKDVDINERLMVLCKSPNVVVTPHSAFYTERALDDMVTNSIKNCANYCAEYRDDFVANRKAK